MSAVWRMTDLSATEKIVLLALADAANDDGVTWMAIKSRKSGKMDFIQKTSLSERAVQNSMKALEARGLLHRDFRDGKGTIYSVLPDPRTTCTPAPRAQTPAPRAPKPSNNPSPIGEVTKRASARCPESWYPSPEDFSVGREEGLSGDVVARELKKFRDHTFKPARSDWSATFRNWLRNAAERKPTNGTPVSSKLDHLDRVSAAMAAAGQWDTTERRGDSFDAEPSGGMPLLRSIS